MAATISLSGVEEVKDAVATAQNLDDRCPPLTLTRASHQSTTAATFAEVRFLLTQDRVYTELNRTDYFASKGLLEIMEQKWPTRS